MMAREAAPYVHARLSAAMVTSHSNINNNRDNDDTNVLQIYAVPRGGKINPKDGTITVEGDPVTELQSVEPFTGTPALTDQHEYKRVEPEPTPFETVELEPPQNITVLNPYSRRQRDDSDDGSSPDAD